MATVIGGRFSHTQIILVVLLLLAIIVTLLGYHRPTVVKFVHEMTEDDQLEPFLQRLKDLLNDNSTKEEYPDFVKPLTRFQLGKFKKWQLKPNLSKLILGALDSFAVVCKQANLTWFLSAGTLLGSYRHHGMIPWDVDIDVVMNKSDRDSFTQAWNKTGNTKEYALDTSFPWIKIWPRKGSSEGTERKYKTPSMDVFFWQEDEKRLWANFLPKAQKTDIFPLVNRPFNGKMYPGPRDPRLNLQLIFGHKLPASHECIINRWDYLRKQPKPEEDRLTVNCSGLLNDFPFVRHVRGEGSAYCKEELVFKGHVIFSYNRSAVGIPVC